MKEKSIKFKAKEKHRVCIYLKPMHFDFLRRLSYSKYDGDISKTILYLLSKYLKYLYQIKNIDRKRTMTIEYQPKTREYRRYWISMTPTLWGNLNNLRFSLGYSMSYLIRIMLDWEMEENREPKADIIIPKPILNETSQPVCRLMYNYAQKVWIYHPSRWVYLRLSGYD